MALRHPKTRRFTRQEYERLADVPGSPRDYSHHPQAALLIIEISDTTLRFDRNRKASQYAYAGIEDHWIVNLIDGRLEVYRGPQRNARFPRKSTYETRTDYEPNDTVSPLALPQVIIKVADLLP
jgi:Uma2 family endonuclease